MIPRYDRSEISELWADKNKFENYLKVELAVLKALEGDKIPHGIAAAVKEKAIINPERIDEIEKVTKHDVIAFCTSITENLPADIGKFFHFGVTSSDIIDSALTLQIKDSLKVILPLYKKLLKSIHKRAIDMKSVATIGRSHGMYAEPFSFGQKLLGFYCEFSRHYQELENFYKNDLTIQISGAVGNYTILTPEVEEKVAVELGVKVEPLSTQVIPRDRIAKLININALIAAAIERICVEIRHLHRSDVAELHEGFSKGQKGSSTMPHKKNPISGENLTGIARVLRSHMTMAHENIVLWHERDISHSSAERMYLPDNLTLMYYAINRLTDTVDNLVFHNEKIEEKVENEFTYLSSYYLHHFIEHSDLTRESLYELVQKASFEGHKTGKAEDFYNALVLSAKEQGIETTLPSPSISEIKAIYLKHVDEIFSRVEKAYPL